MCCHQHCTFFFPVQYVFGAPLGRTQCRQSEISTKLNFFFYLYLSLHRCGASQWYSPQSTQRTRENMGGGGGGRGANEGGGAWGSAIKCVVLLPASSAFYETIPRQYTHERFFFFFFFSSPLHPNSPPPLFLVSIRAPTTYRSDKKVHFFYPSIDEREVLL